MKFGKDEALSWLISLYPRIYTIANSRLLAIIMAWHLLCFYLLYYAECEKIY